MINSELLKSAIADAKAVKKTAMVNAKFALEEAFAPRFHAMFADKLKEELGEEEMDVDTDVKMQDDMPVDEVSAPNQVSGAGGEAKGPSTKDVSKGQPKKVSDANTNFKTVAVGGSEGAAGSNAPAAEDSIMKETSDVDFDDESGITSDDLDEIIRELEAEVAEDGEGEPEPEFPEEQPSPEGQANPDMPAPQPPAEAPAPEAPASMEAPPEGGEVPQEPAPVNPEEQPQPEVPEEEPDVEEEIDLDALLEALTSDDDDEEEEEEEEEEEMKDEMDESKEDGISTDVGGQDKSGGVKGYPTAPKASGKNHNIDGKGNIGDGEVGGKPTNETFNSLRQENEDLKGALNEHVKAIKYLKDQINEVNLLNAKLLYTTKLFKEHNLDNKEKMRVVETFDLLKNVREVKLTYAGMCEALNFRNGGKKTSSKSSRIVESYASRPVASTKPSREIISESKEMADRFKKLAGIKAR